MNNKPSQQNIAASEKDAQEWEDMAKKLTPEPSQQQPVDGESCKWPECDCHHYFASADLVRISDRPSNFTPMHVRECKYAESSPPTAVTDEEQAREFLKNFIDSDEYQPEDEAGQEIYTQGEVIQVLTAIFRKYSSAERGGEESHSQKQYYEQLLSLAEAALAEKEHRISELEAQLSGEDKSQSK